MYATNYFETAILNSMRGTTLTAPATMFLALYITDPTDTGQAGAEVAYEGYQRQPVTFSAPAEVTGGVGIQNDAQITFPKSASDAGTVAYIGLMDSVTGGNMWAHGALTDSLPLNAGTAPVFSPGDLTFTFTGDLTKAYKTNYLNVFRGQNVAGFTLFVALYNGDPESGGAELSGTNYARVGLSMTAPSEADSGQMRMSNSQQASFNRPSTNWGTWSYTALYNLVSGGQAVWKQAKSPTWDLRPGRMPLIEQGALTVAVN